MASSFDPPTAEPCRPSLADAIELAARLRPLACEVALSRPMDKSLSIVSNAAAQFRENSIFCRARDTAAGSSFSTNELTIDGFSLTCAISSGGRGRGEADE